MKQHLPEERSARAESIQPTCGFSRTQCAIWLLIVPFVLFLVFFWPVLSPLESQRSHISGDLLSKDYPFRLFAMRSLLHGDIPLWDEHVFGGWPGIANSELAFFYPPNVLLLPFWGERGFSYYAFEWWILLHLYFAGVGTALLGRRYGLSVHGALIAAVTMTFSGFLVAHKIHSNIVQTIVWLPWILFCLEVYLSRQRLTALWAGMGCLICAYFAGHPQMAVYLTFVVVLRLIWEVACADSDRRQTALRRALMILFAVGISGLATMVQWLPTRDLVAQSERSAPAFERSTELALPLVELVDAILPETADLPGLNPGTEVFYWGIGALILVVFCIPVLRLRGPAGFYALLAFIAVILSLGAATAAHSVAYYLIPGIAWFRAPSRWMVVVTLALALAAGRGFDAVVRDRVLGNTRNVRAYSGLFGAFFFLSLLVFLFLVVQRFFLPGLSEGQASGLMRHLVFVLVCLAASALLFVLYMLEKLPAAGLAVAVVLLIFWDLATVHSSREIEPDVGRYVWDENVETILGDPTAGRVKVRFGFEGADRRQYNAHVFGFRELDGESPYKTRDYTLRRPLTRLEDPFRINYRFLDLCQTEYILADNRDLRNPWEHVTTYRWHNSQAPSPTRWYGRSLTLSPDAIFRLLNVQSFPYDRVALTSTHGPEELGDSTWRILGYDVPISVPLLIASVSQAGLRHQALIAVDGADRARNGRGYNVVVLDPGTSEVVSSDAFDTLSDYIDPGVVKEGAPENTRMARFIEEIPDGHIVVAAVREEGTNILQQNAVKALQSCGSSLDLRRQPHLAHAMVGVKGSPAGTAMEVLGATEGLIMTMPDSDWLYTPQLPSIDVSWNLAYLNAYAIWQTLSSTPGPFSRVVMESIGDEKASIHIPVVVFSSPKDDTLPIGVERDRAGIFVGGQDWSLNRRGYNLATFDAKDGDLLEIDAFDIGADWNAAAGVVVPGTPENTRMVRFLQSAPDGAVVIGAVRDEGCNILQPETVDALHGVGCSLDLRKKFRWAHAFVGIKGATPGTAIEIASATHVIIHTVVKNSRWPNLNTSLPVLEPQRRIGLLQRHIPVLRSSHNEEDHDRLPARQAETSVSTATEERTFPVAEETDLRQQDRQAEWAIHRLSPEEFEIVGSATQEGILFLSESFDPDWHAYVNHEEVEIVPIMRFFRGIRLPAGNHAIRMVYEPRSFVRGAMLTFLGLLIWLGLGFAALRNVWGRTPR